MLRIHKSIIKGTLTLFEENFIPDFMVEIEMRSKMINCEVYHRGTNGRVRSKGPIIAEIFAISCLKLATDAQNLTQLTRDRGYMCTNRSCAFRAPMDGILQASFYK